MTSKISGGAGRATRMRLKALRASGFAMKASRGYLVRSAWVKVDDARLENILLLLPYPGRPD